MTSDSVGATHRVTREAAELQGGLGTSDAMEDVEPPALGSAPTARVHVRNVVIACLLGLWTATSLTTSIAVGSKPTEILGLVNGFGLTGLILAVACGLLYWLLQHRSEFSFSPTAAILGVCYAGFWIVGESYFHLNSWDFIFASGYQFCFAVAVYLGYFVLFYAVVRVAIGSIDSWAVRTAAAPVGDGELASTSAAWTRITAAFRRRPIGFSMLVIGLAWLPFLLAFFPGSVPHDGLFELNMYFGVDEWTNHHPIVSTWFMGVFMQFGRLFGSDNLGIFSYVLAQSVLFAFAFGYLNKVIAKLSVPRWIGWASLAYAAFFPFWPAYAQAEVKDTAFTAFYVLFATLIVDIIIRSRQALPTPVVPIGFLVLTSLLVGLTRNNGIYVVLPTIALLLFVVVRRYRVFLGLALLTIMVVYWGFTSVLVPRLGIEQGSIREAMSVPFQQTARYMVEHPDDVSESEWNAINGVLPADKVAEKYNPQLSDPVKNMYRSKASRADMKLYLEAWASMFAKHPTTYIQATLNNTYGYFYFGDQIQILGNLQYYQKGAPIAKGNFDYAYPESLRPARAVVKAYSQLWWDLPGLGLLYSSGLYTWVLAFLVAILVRRRSGAGLVVMLPAALSLAVCLASPVNGLPRYMMPVMATIWLLIAWALHEVREGKAKAAEA